MSLSGETYSVDFDEDEAVLTLTGTMRLSTREYLAIKDFMIEAIGQAEEQLSLDLTRLEFMNSSGINTLYQVAMALRKREDLAVRVLGDKAVGWQAKSLANFRRFAPSSELEWV
ncbi:MAG: hypothetical protein H6741_23430 [Alphaproteobacteria bacterium]|nr:hypothetical protein [Alphaproteobacteria bacterium]MCB9795661.1 hypothetical protein [Alphaproteobacteria bacterium]